MPALIFDCDGVLADTERYGHLPAFNETFAEFGVPVHWSDEEYAQKVLIGGGKERMATLLTPEFVAAADLPPTRPAASECWPSGTSARRRTTPSGRRREDPARARHRPDRRGGARRGVATGRRVHLRGAVGAGRARARRRAGPGRDFTVFAGDIVPAQEAGPGDLPARMSSSWAWRRQRGGRGQRQRAAGRAGCRAGLRGHGHATPSTRTSPAPRWWCPASATRTAEPIVLADPARAAAGRAGRPTCAATAQAQGELMTGNSFSGRRVRRADHRADRGGQRKGVR